MAKLIYGMMCSLDGYVSDRNGDFDWGQVSEEVHRFAEAEQEREGTAIYGRRMYQTMVYWETADQDAALEPYFHDFARSWQGLDKLVVSTTLPAVTSRRTRLVRELDADEVRKLKANSAKDISVSGPTLASALLRKGLVDEVSVYYVPVVVGGGTPMFSDVERILKLDRLEERGFGNGVVFVRYAVRA